MRTLYIFKGLPGSGKSTEAAALVKKEPKRWIRINRDDLRGMVVGPGNNPHSRDDSREGLVRTMKNEMVRQAFKDGYDVILDDTHLVAVTVKKLHELAASIGDVKVIEKGVNVDVATCIERDSKRTGFAKVGEKVIKDFARVSGVDKGRKLSDKEAYYPPRWTQGAPGGPIMPGKVDPNLPSAIMCDLDGTLAIMGDRSPYDATDCDVKDHPNWPVIKTVIAAWKQGETIIFMSGRDSKYRPETIRFIEKYCTVATIQNTTCARPDNEEIVPIPYQLHMRPQGDTRKDSLIKEELYAEHVQGKFNVLYVLDDRNQVVDKWREMGLTCYQVAPGNF